MSRTLHTLFFSPTDATAQIVAAIAEGMGADAVAHDLTRPTGRAKPLAFGPDDVAIIGAPAWYGRVPRPMVPVFGLLKAVSTPAVIVTVYGNRAYEDALLELTTLCEESGFVGVAAGAFVAQHSTAPAVGTGRPDASDLEFARALGIAAAAKLAETPVLAAMPHVDVPGQFPFKPLPKPEIVAPSTSDDCIQCGLCAENCPVAAISFNDFRTIAEGRCVRCASCEKHCPVGAKVLDHPGHLMKRAWLTENFAERRQTPEVFI